ncbi:MAG: heme-binding domain-containing protein [Bacteroidota bacterium]
MKNSGFFLILFSTAAFFISTSLISNVTPDEPEMPKDVKKVIEKSCFGCHNSDSKNEDAKEELDFKTLNDLSKVRKITKLRDIAEVIEEGEMPPKKFLENYPDRKLTEEDAELLTKWAKSEAAALIGD